MIKVKQPPSKIRELCAINKKSGKVELVRGLCCMRKAIRESEGKLLFKRNKYFVFISNPHVVSAEWLNPVLWLHCYKDENIIKNNAPKELMSESDFVDPLFFPFYNNTKNKKKIDYIYFCLNNKTTGITYKGFDVFLKLLPYLNSCGMKGKLIFYAPLKGKIDIPYDRKRYKKHLFNSNLEIIYKGYNQSQLSREMSLAKVCLFPNIKDCSPRLIPESLLSNTPVVVNRNIDGGWKYCKPNNEFGLCFENPENICEIINKASEIKETRNKWINKYGFEKSSRKLATMLHKVDALDEKYSHIYFSCFSKVMEKINEK